MDKINFHVSEIHKILCIKPRGIGDIVLSTIILDNLKSAFPIARIDYLIETFAKDVLSNNPIISKIFTLEKSELPFNIGFKLRKEKYDLVIDLYSNPRTAQITFLTGAKYRVGYSYRGRKYAYNIKAESGRGNHHAAEHNLELLKVLEVPIISKKIHFYLSEEGKTFAKEFIEKNFDKTNETIIGIIPSGGWTSKRCDKGKWVEICRSILQKYRVKFLILWGPGDEIDANYIKDNLYNKAILSPKTTIMRLSALIKNCDLVIANDSGPMHISAALGVPTLGIFGPTNPEHHGPYSMNSDYVIKDDLFCIICNKLECPYHHECMFQLDNNKILEKLEKIGNDVLKF
jgi:lipopolysaccharide heptosyltransferase II